MSTPHFPGWYPDPDQPGRERLWDGHAWTHHLRKAAESSATVAPRTIALAIGSGVLGLLLIVGLVAAGLDRGIGSRPNRNRAARSSKQCLRTADICSGHTHTETGQGSGS
jgi:hypothetical protein